MTDAPPPASPDTPPERSGGSLLQSLEELFYDLCLLSLFYPWLMLRLIARPGRVLGEWLAAERGGVADDSLISPPVLFIITALVSAVLLPPVGDESTRLFGAFANIFSSTAIYARAAENAGNFLIYALFNALVIEWLTPGGVTRSSFRLPLFANLLVVAPPMLALLCGITLQAGLHPAAGAVPSGAMLWRLLAASILIIAALGWYLRVQLIIYRTMTGIGAARALPLICLSIAAAEGLGLLIAMTAG